MGTAEHPAAKAGTGVRATPPRACEAAFSEGSVPPRPLPSTTSALAKGWRDRRQGLGAERRGEGGARPHGGCTAARVRTAGLACGLVASLLAACGDDSTSTPNIDAAVVDGEAIDGADGAGRAPTQTLPPGATRVPGLAAPLPAYRDFPPAPAGYGEHCGGHGDCRGRCVDDYCCADLVVVDLASVAAGSVTRYYDEQVLLTAMQGIVNRAEPRLFVRVPKDPQHEDFWYNERPPGSRYTDYDSYWLDKLRGWHSVCDVTELTTFEALGHFASEIAGAVVWHEEVPATLNAAFTVAGVEALLPLRFDASDDSLYQETLGSGLITVQRDLADLRTKRAVYRWLIDEYVDTEKVAANWAGYTLDGFYLRYPRLLADNPVTRLGQPESNHVYNAQIFNRDFLVAHRALMFDLQPYGDVAPFDDPAQPPGADLRILNEILAALQRRLADDELGTVVGFPNWGFKYTRESCERILRSYGDSGCASTMTGWEVEWRFAQTISEHHFAKDADAIHPAAMSNASVYAHFPVRARAPNRPPARPPRYDPERKYALIYMGDFDSASWVWFHGRYLWDDPARGDVPLAWGFNPNLASRVGPAFRYFFETATANDYFVGGDTGAGYINPGFLDAAGLARWETHCRRHYERLGYTMTGWSLNGFAGAFTRPVMERFARFSPGGVVTHDGHASGAAIEVVDGTTFVQELTDRSSGNHIVISLRSQESAAQLARLIADNAPDHGMIALRNVLMEPTRVAALARALEARGTTVVDPYTFFDFAARRASSSSP